MSINKFEQNDIFVNTIKTRPYSKFRIYNGQITYRADFASSVSEGNTALFDLNIANGDHNRYIYKDSSRLKFKSGTEESYFANDRGDVLSQEMPLQSTISFQFFPDALDQVTSTYYAAEANKLRLKSLEPIGHKYTKYSHFFDYNEFEKNPTGNGIEFYNKNIMVVSIPSIFYGDSLEKGSLKLTTYCDGVAVSTIQDINRNGELRSISGTTLLASEGVAGLVFYDEGIILLFDSTELSSYEEDFYVTNSTPSQKDKAKWYNFGISSLVLPDSVVKTSYSLEFNGIHKIPQLTMLAHAAVGKLNHSNNRTFTKKQQDPGNLYTVSEEQYNETVMEIKNITKTEYKTPVPVFEKETYISKILIYDENMKVIGQAKLAKPIRKTENRNFTFKLKLDL